MRVALLLLVKGPPWSRALWVKLLLMRALWEVWKGIAEGALVGVVLEEGAVEWGASLPFACLPGGKGARGSRLLGGLREMLWMPDIQWQAIFM